PFLVMKPLGGVSFSTSSPATSPVIRVLDGWMVWPWANASPGARAIDRVTTVAMNRYCARMLSSFRPCLLRPISRVGLAMAVLHLLGTCDPGHVAPSGALGIAQPAGVSEGGVAPPDPVLGDPLGSAGRKNPCKPWGVVI